VGIEIVGISTMGAYNVSHLTLIGAVEGNWTLVDDGAQFDWCDGRWCGCLSFGWRIYPFKRTVGLYAACAVYKTARTGACCWILLAASR
jgi:hypothetical protein